MKRFLVVLICSLMLMSSGILAKDKIRIGVYDSRVIAVWYIRGEENGKVMKELMNDMKKAKQKEDTEEIKKIEAKGQLLQKIAHDKGFGRGSVAEILEKYKKEIEKIAKQENLSLILSKWELNYSGEDVELVDITVTLLKELKAPEEVIKMSGEMMKHDPVKNAFFLED